MGNLPGKTSKRKDTYQERRTAQQKKDYERDVREIADAYREALQQDTKRFSVSV